MVAYDGRAREGDRRAASRGVEGELDADRPARLTLDQAADARGQLGGQHGLGPERQVEARRAAPRLGVDGAVGRDEERHVGDVHPGSIARTVGAHRDRVVEVARAVGVDRERGQGGQIAAAGVGCAVAGRRPGRRLVDRLGGELSAHAVSHLEPLEHGRQVPGGAQHLDDHHAVVLGRHGQHDVVDMRGAPAARHEVAALVSEQRLERPELAPAHHTGGQQRGRRHRQSAHGRGRGAPTGSRRAGDPGWRGMGGGRPGPAALAASCRRRGTGRPGPGPRRAASWGCRRPSRWG